MLGRKELRKGTGASCYGTLTYVWTQSLGYTDKLYTQKRMDYVKMDRGGVVNQL